MLKGRIHPRVISDICDTLLSEEASLLVDTRRFVLELEHRLASDNGKTVNPDYDLWAAGQAKNLQRRHRQLVRGWRRVADQFRG